MARELTLGEFEVKFEAHEQRDLDRFQAMMDKMNEGFKTISDKLDDMSNQLKLQVGDHETRIRAMEKYQWLQMGAAGVVGAIVVEIINLVSGTVHITGL